MPIRIKHLDKKCTSAQQPEMALVSTESTLFPKVSYMDQEVVIRILCGSIYTLVIHVKRR